MKFIKLKCNSQFQTSLAGACSLLLVLGAVQSALGQQAAPVPRVVDRLLADSPSVAGAETGSNERTEETAGPDKQNKPGHDGIKIHGHWVIDVRNPDGRLVQHRDFENSLVTNGAAMSGDQILAALLSGNASVGDPAIVFIQGNINGLGIDNSLNCVMGQVNCWPALTTAQAASAYATAVGTSILGPGEVTGLSTTVNFSPSVNWVLSGNVTVPSGTYNAINAVESFLPLCVGIGENPQGPTITSGPHNSVVLAGSLQGRSSTLASAACTVPGSGSSAVLYGALTAITIVNGSGTPAPLTNLVPGQIITVSLTLSFS